MKPSSGMLPSILLLGLLALVPSEALALARTFTKTMHLNRFRAFTAANDYIYDSTTDSSGNIYVAGATDGSLPGFTNAGGLDGFVAKFNSGGALQWIQQIGTSGDDVLYGVTVDTTGAPIGVGYTEGSFPTFTNAGSFDVVAVKYSTAGVQAWLTQFGTSGSDIAYGATRDSTNNPIIVGSTSGAFPTYTNSGGKDMFVTERTSAAGAQTWMRQTGTTGDDELYSAGIDSSNRAYVVGYTGGSFPTFTNAGGDDAYVARITTAGAVGWQKQRGTAGDDYANVIPMTTAGVNYPSGTTSGTWSGNSSAGGEDGWIMKYNAGGTTLSWTKQFGSAGDDGVRGGRIDTSSRPLLVGNTSGSMSGYTNAGATDLFFARFTTAGVNNLLTQYGTAKNDTVEASGVTSITTVPCAGHSDEAWSGYSVLKGYDTYVFSFNTSGVHSVLNQMGSSN